MVLLEYNLTATGLADIERAYKTLEGYARQHNANVRRILGESGPTRATRAGGASRALGASNTNASLREAEALYRAQEKAAQKEARLTEKTAQAAVKAQERAEKAKTRELQVEARKRERIIEAETRAELREMEKRERAAYQLSKRRYGRVGEYAGRGLQLGAHAIALTGLAGGALAASALHEQLKIGASASGLANQMVGAGAGPAEIAAQKKAIMEQAAKVRGASSMDAIGAARAFGGISGSYDLGLKMAQDFTKISLATDVSLEDISRLAGNAYMKIKTPGMSEDEARKQTLEAVRTFAGQGNIGAVEIKDLAQYGGRLTAAAAQFKGSRVENMAKMGTLAQVAVGSGSATDAAEATMAAARFASDLTEHASDVAKLKVGGKAVNPYTDSSRTQFRSIDTLVADIMQGTGGDMSKMKDIFGERSYKMAQGFQQIYLDAEKNQKGSGRQAVMDKFAEFAKAAVSEKDVETRAAARLSDADMQLEMAFKDLKQTVGSELMPAFVELVPTVKDLIPIIGDAFHSLKEFLGALNDADSFLAKLFPKSHIDSVERAHQKEISGTGGGSAGAHERVILAKKHLAQLQAEDAKSSNWFFDSSDSKDARHGAIMSAQAEVERAERQERYAARQEKLSEETEKNTTALKDLTTALKMTPGGGSPTGRGGAMPPRGADGSPPSYAD